MGPRALPASVVLRGSISAQQTAASCRRQRARAVTATTESRQKHARTSVLAALPLPNHGESAAADLAASYTGLGIPVLPIEAARTYAPGISTGAVAVFRAFSTPSPAPRSGFAARGSLGVRSPVTRVTTGVLTAVLENQETPRRLPRLPEHTGLEYESSPRTPRTPRNTRTEIRNSNPTCFPVILQYIQNICIKNSTALDVATSDSVVRRVGSQARGH